jgi:hypothetical protein
VSRWPGVDPGLGVSRVASEASSACLHFAQEALQTALQRAELARHIGIGVGPQSRCALFGFGVNLPGSLARCLYDGLIVEAGIELGLGFVQHAPGLGTGVSQDPLTLASNPLPKTGLIGYGLTHLAEDLSNDSLIYQHLAAGRHPDAVLKQVVKLVNQVQHGSVHSSIAQPEKNISYESTALSASADCP